MELIHRLDIGLLEAFNTLAQRSLVLDRLVAMVVQNALVKSGVLVGPLWYFWFSSEGREENRRCVVRVILGACLAIFVGRALQTALPARLRPMHEPGLLFRVPFGVETHSHFGWSSFPSDHAVLFIALATGVWAISRRFGILAFIWVTVVVCSARVYAGLHYPSDILGGAVLGFAIMSLVLRESTITPRVVDSVLAMESRRAALFYPAAFIVSWQLAEIFGESRDLAMTLWRVVRYTLFGLEY